MKATKTLAAILVTVAAGGAFAQEASPGTGTLVGTGSMTTRQAVDAQARSARVSGQIAYGEAAGHDFSSSVHGKLSRTQVAAEAREAQRQGLTQSGEVQKIATQSQLESIRRAGEEALGTNVASR
jgi:hypothetical protein